MNHLDHVKLIKKAIMQEGGVWADFGSGWGAFTLALRDLGGEEIKIYSVDQDKSSLEEQRDNFEERFPNSNITFINQSFTNNLELPKLDGILMANSLHYIKDPIRFLKQIKNYLKPEGKIVIVEYNSDKPNTWVPYPLSFKTLKRISSHAGYSQAVFLNSIASDFMTEIYSAEII